MQVQILIPGREDAFENYTLAVKASGGVPVFWVSGAPLPPFKMCIRDSCMASNRANRGYNSARNWNWNNSSNRNANLGFRPAL